MERWEAKRTLFVSLGIMTWTLKKTNKKKVPAVVIRDWHCQHDGVLRKCKLKCQTCGSSCVVRNYTNPGIVVCCDAVMETV